jgi:amino acid transporter
MHVGYLPSSQFEDASGMHRSGMIRRIVYARNALIEAEKARPVRVITGWDLAGLSLNAIIGAGIFGLPSSVARLMGVSSPIAFILCAIIVSLLVLSFAEVASRFNESGGPYIYARRTLGPFVGFEVGWSAWLSRVSSFAANSNVLVAYLGFFLPVVTSGAWRTLALAGVALSLAIVNVRGVRSGAHLSDALAILKVLGLALFSVMGLFFVDWNRFSAFSLTPSESWGAAIMIVIYAFTGFESAVMPAAEARNPQRDIPRALIGSLAVCTVIYLAVQVVAVGTVANLSESERPLADSAQNFMGPAAGGLVSLLAVASVIGNLGGSMLGSPRLTYAFAENGDVPTIFAKLHPTSRTPVVSIAVFAIISAILAISGTFVWLATISVMARLVTYGVTCLAVPMLRKRSDSAPMFRLPLGPAVPVLGIALIVWLFMQTNRGDVMAFGVALIFGALLYAVAHRTK